MPKRKPALFFLVAVSISLWTTTLWAQDTVQPTTAQLELNEQGVEAIIAENYDEAVNLFQASLSLGRLNITHINLGRAYQRAGDCFKAEEQYQLTLDAPVIADPPPSQIGQTVRRYRQELQESCPGKLIIRCTPESMALHIGDEGPLACDGTELLRPPGEHLVRGELDGEHTEITVALKALQTERISLSLAPSARTTSEPEKTLTTTVAPPPEVEPASRASYVWLGAGGATLVGALALDIFPASASNGEFDALDFVPIGLYAVGIGAVVYGVMQLMD
ncbi:MAG: tetratricopeptide repeat protein [Bradymonadaceae bacterium]